MLSNKMFRFLWTVFVHIKYEIRYYMLGTRGILEDLFYRSNNKCETISLPGEIAVVTGGSRGLGAVVVKKLLQCEMTVIIGCRNIIAGEKIVQEIRESGINSGNAIVLKVDMASLKSIESFAEVVINKTNNKLNLLINNAGIMFPPYRETVDGFESQWGVNYVGHFYLTHLLMKCLKETGELSSSNSRIVNVTSCAHWASNDIDFDDINMKHNYIPSAGYAQSKLAQLLFTKKLDSQLQQMGVKVRAIAVHPGIVDTDIFNDTWVRKLFPWVMKLLFKTPDEGGVSIMYAAISPKLNNKGGMYTSNCREMPVSKLAEDHLLQEKLFNHTLASLKLKEFGIN